MKLYDHQLDALQYLHNGSVLCGGVGSGKSITALGYYWLQQGGKIETLKGHGYHLIEGIVQDLYIITTAKKRDKLEWDKEMIPFGFSRHETEDNYDHKVVVDSWNNIGKYSDVKGAFFIFDEQRVVGNGAWVKAFLKIARGNNWILLSATPGDTWSDYIPVFIANGFFRNRSDFNSQHVVFKPYAKFPQIDRYVGVGRLIRLRKRILVDMDFFRETIPHHEDVHVEYNLDDYKRISRDRWNIWDEKPLENPSQYCYALRKVVNSDVSRQIMVLEILEKHPKAIIFYNFDYELEILLGLGYENGTEIAQWNGHKHQEVPEGDKWVYLVQYNAGNEGWNCIKTDTIIFFSQNYSYKVMTQAAGRIDRLNTRYTDLWYYHLVSRSKIDLAIKLALKKKQNFNKRRFYDG